MKKSEQLATLLAPAVTGLGYELVGVSYHPNSVNALLRVYIDKPGGIDLDDCLAVNEQVSGILDVEDPIPGRYTLEVSSPGLDRPLFNLKDFKKFIGAAVKIRLSRPIEQQRNFKATIIKVSDQLITIEEENQKQTELPIDLVEVARLIPTFD